MSGSALERIFQNYMSQSETTSLDKMQCCIPVYSMYACMQAWAWAWPPPRGGGMMYSGPKVQSFLFSAPLFSQTNGAEKRTNGAEKRTNLQRREQIVQRRESNLGPPYKWCREENKWCREEKVYFGATVMMAPHTGGTGSGNLVNYECPVIKDGWPTASCPSSLKPGNTWKIDEARVHPHRGWLGICWRYWYRCCSLYKCNN